MAQEKDDHEYVTEKMFVTRRSDSRYSKSHKKPGELSPLTRSGDDELGQVTLSHIDEDDDPSRSYSEPVDTYGQAEPPHRSKEQEERDDFVRAVVRDLLLIAIERGTPYAKRLWIQKVRPAIQARAQIRGERRALRRQRRVEKGNAVTEAKIIDPTQDMATAAAEFNINMTSSEAQARYLVARAAQRFADAQMRLIADAGIRADGGFQELEHALSELPPEQVAKMLRRFEVNPSLLAGDALTGLGMILGVDHAENLSSVEDRRGE
jgi:hypothetical protein